MKVTVIVPAAGLGTRMASAAKDKKPTASKQFAELKGKPILVRTLSKFAMHPEVHAIFVALRKEEIPLFQARLEREAPEILAKKPVLLEGGEHRQQSVANALAQISAANDDVILVHDRLQIRICRSLLQVKQLCIYSVCLQIRDRMLIINVAFLSACCRQSCPTSMHRAKFPSKTGLMLVSCKF